MSRAQVRTQLAQEQLGLLQPLRCLGRRCPLLVLHHLGAPLVLPPLLRGEPLLPDSARSESRVATRSETAERTARTTPKPPKKAPAAVSGHATRRGKRAPTIDTPSRAPLAAAASKCSWV